MRRVILALLALSMLSGCGIPAPTTDCDSATWESFNAETLPAEVLAHEFKVTCSNGAFAVEVIR
jgi:hypothetical protein